MPTTLPKCWLFSNDPEDWLLKSILHEGNLVVLGLTLSLSREYSTMRGICTLMFFTKLTVHSIAVTGFSRRNLQPRAPSPEVPSASRTWASGTATSSRSPSPAVSTAPTTRIRSETTRIALLLQWCSAWLLH